MTTKVIYIEGSALIDNAQGGIGHYTKELVHQLSKHSDYELHLLLMRGQSLAPDVHLSKKIIIDRLPIPRKFYMVIWRILHVSLDVSRYLPRKPDVIIYPNFALIPKVAAASKISVIHDLTFLHYPETVERRNLSFLRRAVKEATEHSTAIIAPSKFSRDDIIKYYSPSVPVLVAYPGYDNLGAEKNTSKSSNYLLFIGTLEPRKNVNALCRAFIESELPSRGFQLKIAGKRGWGDIIIPPHPSIEYLGVVSDEIRADLLGHAKALVFPSIFEGFGMPVVEAMQHHLLVISTDGSSLSEIVSSNNAIIIERPFDIENIRTALDIFSNTSDSVLHKLTDAAYASTSHFTWGNCAEIFTRLIDNE